MSEAHAVLLAGAGSDEVFLAEVFADALRRRGFRGHFTPAEPGDVVGAQRRALDAAAARRGPLLVGGVSLGAGTALGWALDHPERVHGVLVALPAWTGTPTPSTPAAASARTTAAALRHRGLAAVLADVRAGSPEWLATELARAWSRQQPHLADALERAARTPGPTLDQLTGLDVPVGIAACRDDPLHPLAVAEQLVTALPRARLGTLDLAGLGTDRGRLGRRCVRAWEQARDDRPSGR